MFWNTSQGILRNQAALKQPKEVFTIIHPLDDSPEQKLDPSELGPMPLTRSVRFSLLALRAYLVLMAMLVGYRVLELAGLLSRHAG